MPRVAQTHWIDRFQGYSDAVNPGDPAKLTKDLNNVKFRFGRVLSRGGMSKYQSISTASSNIIGLYNYRNVSGTHVLFRQRTTALEKFSGGAWNDVTGTALNGTSTTRPQYTIIDDTLVFTTEGADRPRKVTTGNSSDIAASSAPFCKGIIAYLGFLFCFNVSDSGAFTDVVDGHRIGRYADDWDTAASWSPCDTNEINLDETPGPWLAAVGLERNMFALKGDGVVKVRWIGGKQVFQQDGVASDVGIVSPLSLGIVGRDPGCANMAFWLGTDGIIYQLTADGSITPISYTSLFELIPNTASLNKLKYARGMVDSEDDTYYLYYDRTGLSNQLLDSYVSYNYLTKEWSKGRLPSINACVAFKDTDQAAESLIVSSTTLVYNFDDTSADDDGTAVSGGRYWTSGWQKMEEEGWLHRIRFVFSRSNYCYVAISIAEGYGEEFGDEQVFKLVGAKASQTHVEVIFNMPTPRLVDWVNVKVRMVHTAANATVKLEKIGFETSSILPTTEKIPKQDVV
jgi:hypothetical protein